MKSKSDKNRKNWHICSIFCATVGLSTLNIQIAYNKYLKYIKYLLSYSVKLRSPQHKLGPPVVFLTTCNAVSGCKLQEKLPPVKAMFHGTNFNATFSVNNRYVYHDNQFVATTL